MSPLVETLNRYNNGFPRVSGDEPFQISSIVTKCGFSPRERG